MSSFYHIRLLGPIQLEKDGRLLQTVRSRKGLALLGYLCQQSRPVSRAHLAEMFWPERAEAIGLRNLSREMSKLASQLPGCFQADYYTVQFEREAPYWVDTRAFSELVSGFEFKVPEVELSSLVQTEPPSGEAEVDLAKLAQAVALYQGDFMAGHYLDGCPEFETWLLREQEAWRQQVSRILEGLVAIYMVRRQDQPAEGYLRRWLVLEPWHEAAHQLLMVTLARNGRRSEALAHYEICRQTLAEELEIEPSAETVALYEQIRQGAWEHDGWGGSSHPRASTLLSRLSLDSGQGRGTKPAPWPPCPYQGLLAFTEADAPFFFGREAFTDRLIEAVHRQALVAVVGPPAAANPH